MDTVSSAPLILITGGSRGVGAATARLAAAQGYDVAISFISNEAAALGVVADVQALGRRALAIRADSADPEQVAHLFAAIDETFGRIDVLVNNAAIIALQSRFEDLDFARMQRIFAINAIGPMLCAQHRADGIDCENALHTGEVEVFEARLKRNDGGVVNQHVDTSKRLVNGGEQVGDLFWVCTVGANGQGASPQCLHIGHHAEGGGLVADEADCHVVALRSRQPRRCRADTSAAACDQNEGG